MIVGYYPYKRLTALVARRVQIVRSVIRCLQWRFDAWADDFVDLYFDSIHCPYAEVRGLMAAVLNAIDQLKVGLTSDEQLAKDWQFHPSYPSAAALTSEVLDDVLSKQDIMHIRTGLFEPQLKRIMESLPEWKTERPHGPKAVLSTHDTAALTSLLSGIGQFGRADSNLEIALSWLSVELSDVHAVGAFPYIIPILYVMKKG